MRSYFPGEQAQLHSRLLFHVSALACTRGGSVGCVINTYGSITALKYFLQGFLPRLSPSRKLSMRFTVPALGRISSPAQGDFSLAS